MSSSSSAFLRCVLGAGSLVAAYCAYAESHQVTSPDESLVVTVSIDHGQATYRVDRRSRALIHSSALGFKLVGGDSLADGFVVDAIERDGEHTAWEQPWGEQRRIECHYNEMRLLLRQPERGRRLMGVVFRVFDDGFGFRYEWPEQEALSEFFIAEELTSFAVVGEPEVWWIPAYEREHYEYLYRKTPIGRIEHAHTPATLEWADGTCASLHEAALVDFPSMTIEGRGKQGFAVDLVPWSDGKKARVRAPHQTPWRTMRVADHPGDLITNYLELNLNEPSKIADTSWIEPGKYVGIWWEMHLGKSTWSSGPTHGANNQNVRRYIDFASENGFDGVLVEGWNLGWDGDWISNGSKFDFVRSYPDFDLARLSDYARQRGVRLIGHNETGGATENYERQLEDAFDQYAKHGVRAVKTGYVNFADGLPRTSEDGQSVGEWHYGQFMVRHHQRVIEAAARRRIVIDVHEPVKQTGLRRTYPNLMTAEGARGQEYNAWSTDGGNPPDHTTILPFTRLLAGPMDFTPGIFDLTYPEARPDNRVNTTLAKQLALYVVLYSPLQMAADLPENYASYNDAFQFIRDVPTDWEETRVLAGSIGDYVVIARRVRGGDDWFIGAITDENARQIDVPLEFLEAGQTYSAEIYRDADEAHWETNPTAYRIESTTVYASSTLPLRLAAGGGQAIRLERASMRSALSQDAEVDPPKSVR